MKTHLEHFDLSRRYDRFVRQIVRHDTVWTLQDDDDFFAECPSLHEEDALGEPRMVWCFWSDEAHALRCRQDEWHDYACVSWPLSDFINDVLLPMQHDGQWVGIEFDTELCGMETEPMALLADLLHEIAQQYSEAEFDDWPRWQRACQAWQAEQKRSMH